MQLESSPTHVETAWSQRLKQSTRQLLSNFAFKLTLRRYRKVVWASHHSIIEIASGRIWHHVGLQWVGPGRYCSPRHVMPFNTRNEGPKTAQNECR